MGKKQQLYHATDKGVVVAVATSKKELEKKVAVYVKRVQH